MISSSSTGDYTTPLVLTQPILLPSRNLMIEKYFSFYAILDDTALGITIFPNHFSTIKITNMSSGYKLLSSTYHKCRPEFRGMHCYVPAGKNTSASHFLCIPIGWL